MTAPKLVLHPTRPTDADAPAAVLAAIRALNLLGDGFQLDGRKHFFAGDAFLGQITFLGCAPDIELAPPTLNFEAAARAGRFCHWHLHRRTSGQAIRCRSGFRPRCRHCRGEFSSEDLAGFAVPETRLPCPECGRPTDLPGLSWRQAGGCADVFLDIWGIHNAEAVPGEQLLGALAAATRSDWAFFYIED